MKCYLILAISLLSSLNLLGNCASPCSCSPCACASGDLLSCKCTSCECVSMGSPAEEPSVSVNQQEIAPEQEFSDEDSEV